MGYGNIKAVSRRVYKVSVPSFAGGIDSSLDERVLPLGRGECSYNYSMESGALRESWGLDGSEISAARSVWLYKRYDVGLDDTENILMYAGVDGKVYYRRGEGDFSELAGVSFTGIPLPLNYRLYNEDVIILCSAKDRMVVWDGKADAYTVSDSPYISSLTMHYERMFVTTAGQKNAVWFSDDLGPTNWNPELDEGGFIELLDERGKLNRVLSFNNSVYVFRDYGISRINAYADQSTFSVSNLFVSSGRIYADTAVVCGDVIIFLAADGVYSFDGVSTRKMLKNIDGLLCGGGTPCACWHAGKYWVSFGALFEGEDVTVDNNCVLVLDRHSGAFNLLKGISAESLCPISDGESERLYVVCADGRVGVAVLSGSMFGAALSKVWRSGSIDFNSADRKKFVKEIFIDTEYDAEVTVSTENVSKVYKVKGKAGISRIRTNISGTKLRLSIESKTAKASVARPMVVYSLL